MVLVVDDVHKASPDVRVAISALARAVLSEPPVRFAIAGREVGLPAEIYRDAARVRLGPLGDRDARALAIRLGVPEAAQAGVLGAGRGNPLLLEVLSRSPGARFGDEAARLLSDALGPVERDLLAWMSILRASAGDAVLEALVAGPPAVAEMLVRASLLERSEDGRLSMHDVLRESLMAHIPIAERRARHTRAAEAYRPGPSSDAGEIAEFLHHLVQSGQRDEAVRWVLRNQSRIAGRDAG